jgi:hypothetical protein
MENKDGTFIVVGCGDNRIRIFNTKGEMTDQ